MKQEEKPDPQIGDEISYRSIEGCTVATVEEVKDGVVVTNNEVTVPNHCILEVLTQPMNQAIRNALDDLETAADKVENRCDADMIRESVGIIREELDE